MSRPKPENEITVQGTYVLYIHTATPDARNWVKDNAEDFGELFYPTVIKSHFTLFVSPLYDEAEVKLYILNMGESDDKTQE